MMDTETALLATDVRQWVRQHDRRVATSRGRSHVCPHCTVPVGSILKLDQHLRFTCPELGRGAA